jgi:hypothetical protein
MSCGEFDTLVSASTLTHHFNVLREAGVIRQHYVGTTKMNTLRGDEMESRFPGLLASVVTAAGAETPTGWGRTATSRDHPRTL